MGKFAMLGFLKLTIQQFRMKKINNNKKNSKRGFTLIEVLLVLVIIGILATAVYALIGNSDNAKTKAMLSTARSISTYAQECMFKGENLTVPSANDGSASGDTICVDSETEWPELSVDGCTYTVTNQAYEVHCTGITNYIACDAQAGSCVETTP